MNLTYTDLAVLVQALIHRRIYLRECRDSMVESLRATEVHRFNRLINDAYRLESKLAAEMMARDRLIP